ncbi:hypothetical protein F5B20DRAFT_514710 [Whalleya microplaca]|nr:hypothetical protein F5B20DRAFT_514710 [Whalleya microplaca]
MPHHQHNRLHRRQGNDAWNNLVDSVEKVADEWNPLKPRHTVEARDPAPATVFATVFTTLSPTFEGAIGGYSTVTEKAPGTQAIAAAATAEEAKPTTTTPTEPEKTAVAAQTKVASPTQETATAKSLATDELPGSLMPTKSTDLEDHSTLAVAATTPTTLSQATKAAGTSGNANAANVAASASASASSTAASTSSGGDTSTGAKAGIAIGVLGGILVVGLLIYFLFSRRKKQLKQQQAASNEKFNGPVMARPDSVNTTRTSATAPQLSLRPVTQFMPSFGERRSSKGAAMALAAAAGPASATQQNSNRSPWERPSTSHGSGPENPFGNDAERAYTPTGNESDVQHNQPSNPFNAPENVVGVAQTTNAAGAAGAAGAAALARKASTRKEGPAPLDLTLPAVPPSPAGTEFSMHSVGPGQSPGPSKSAAAIAEAGGPTSSTVHRVQMDFKPTLEDELELRAGQLVRLLHEYDDGWSLVIRLDRSKQGAVPRTCLSTRPVKPRPAGGPGGPGRIGPPVNPSGARGPRGPGPNYPPGQRPMTPQGGPQYPRPESPIHPMTPGGRPQSPAAMRPHSPATGRPVSPYGSRPASPAGGRPMSPGPRQQRPQSPSGASRRMTPPGPSPMNPNGGPQYRSPQGPIGRKPVPGQAY